MMIIKLHPGRAGKLRILGKLLYAALYVWLTDDIEIAFEDDEWTSVKEDTRDDA